MRGWIVVVALVVSVPAVAAQYPGWSDTGYNYYNKRDCCDAAIALAQEDSAVRCAASGGVPRPRAGVRRGSCDSEWTTDAWGRRVFRCVSESVVWCR
jgi:hypothetical protein